MSKEAPKPPVLVLGPSRFIGPLGVMRSLGTLGIQVYGLEHRELSIAGASRFCAGKFEAGANGRPYGAPEQQILDDLLSAGRSLNGEAILVAASDGWARFVSSHSSELAAQFRFPDVAPALIEQLTSKVGLHDMAVRAGVPTPQMQTTDRLEEALAAAEDIGYPVVIKTAVDSAVGVSIASDPAQLGEQFPAARSMGQVIIQEYIDAAGSAWMFNGYFDHESRCLAGFTARKIRQLPAGLGVCTLGVCEWNEELARLSEKFLAAIGYRGLVDIDYVWDQRDACYKILDVNPRLGGAFRVMVDRNGLDVVRSMYLDMTGRAVPAVIPSEGRKWMLESGELIGFMRHGRGKGAGLRRWLRPLAGVHERATLSISDPGPFLVAMAIVADDTIRGRRTSVVSLARRVGRRARATGIGNGAARAMRGPASEHR